MEGNSSLKESPSNESTSVAATDSFVSTWGGIDSLWGTKPEQTKPSTRTKPKKKSAKLQTKNTNSLSSNTSTPSNARQNPNIVTPPNNLHEDPPTPIILKSASSENTNLTSTPIIRQTTDMPLDSVDGDSSNSNNLSNVNQDSLIHELLTASNEDTERGKVRESVEMEEEQMQEIKERERMAEEEERTLLEKKKEEEQQEREMEEEAKRKEEEKIMLAKEEERIKRLEEESRMVPKQKEEELIEKKLREISEYDGAAQECSTGREVLVTRETIAEEEERILLEKKKEGTWQKSLPTITAHQREEEGERETKKDQSKDHQLLLAGEDSSKSRQHIVALETVSE